VIAKALRAGFHRIVHKVLPVPVGHDWITRWKPALNAFAITFEGRLFPSNN
jgi:hypothetical protein